MLYVSPNPASFVGVAPANFGPYVVGQSGQAVNLDNWSTSTCNRGEYASVTVQPTSGKTMTLNQLSFFFARSVAGPVQISMRSSADNFGSDIYTGTATENPPYQQAVIGLSGGAYTNQSGPVTFRIYGCPPQGAGTLRLDEIVVSGVLPQFPLPVYLLYFRAQSQPATADRANRVTLSWATTWERDADYFEVQRSRSLSEFGTIGQLPARGTTNTRQLYDFSDDWPDSGTTYYRLRQVDTDGTATYSNIVAAVLDDNTPTLSVLDSETPGTIRVRGRNLTGATFSVVSMTGQAIPIETRTETDGSIQLTGPLGVGLYVVLAEVDGTKLAQRALVR
ncbi:MAG: hypothetical protein LH609_13170 [Rudanella sp.]|nr:hypothetical protein [Rudanella sp.]